MSILKKLLSIAKKYKLDFCIAHNLTVSIKVYKVLGQTKSLIKYSHEAINSWTNILDHKLGINGLIFSYIDLAILYSDNNGSDKTEVKWIQNRALIFDSPVFHTGCTPTDEYGRYVVNLNWVEVGSEQIIMDDIPLNRE